jgi:uncharacterized membrane protein
VALFHKKILSKEELKALSAAIAEMEKDTSGEIRIIIREKRQWNEMNYSLRDIALKEFHRLGMQKTRDRTGVLIMLLLSEKKLYIVADEFIHTRVEDGTWDKIAGGMSAQFKKGRFLEGLTEAVQAVGFHLKQHFPHKPDDKNELPNEVVQR